MKRLIAVLALALVLLPALAWAQGLGALKWSDGQRISIAAGGNLTSWQASGAQQPAVDRAFEGVGGITYVLVPAVRASFNASYSKNDVRLKPELGLRLTTGSDPVACQVSLGYAVHASGQEFPNEWEAGATASRGWPLTPDKRLAAVLGGGLAYGITTGFVRPSAQARLAYTFAKGGY